MESEVVVDGTISWGRQYSHMSQSESVMANAMFSIFRLVRLFFQKLRTYQPDFEGDGSPGLGSIPSIAGREERKPYKRLSLQQDKVIMSKTSSKIPTIP